MKKLKLLLFLLFAILLGCSSGEVNQKYMGISGNSAVSNSELGIKAIEVKANNYLNVVIEDNPEKIQKTYDFLSENNIEFNSFDRTNYKLLSVESWSEHSDFLNYIGLDKYESEHFQYYTFNKKNQVKKLENIYNRLKNQVLPFYTNKSNSQIKYVILPTYLGLPLAQPHQNVIVDPWDCSSSHEVIHQLVSVKNQAFNEGVAQAYQREGNEIMKNQNVNLVAKYQMENGYNINVLSMMVNGTKNQNINYHAMGSFVYYNFEVLKKSDEFTEFLKSLDYSMSSHNIRKEYKEHLNVDIKKSISNWKKWLKTINRSSDIYAAWN